MRRLRALRRFWPPLLAVLALILAGALIWAWKTPSGYFVLWPDKAHPAAAFLQVPGGKPPAAGTGFYFVDVHEIEANKLEELWGRYLVHGATLCPCTSWCCRASPRSSRPTRTSRRWTRPRSSPRRWPSTRWESPSRSGISARWSSR